MLTGSKEAQVVRIKVNPFCARKISTSHLTPSWKVEKLNKSGFKEAFIS
jgi:hypothetical protein